MRKLYILVRTDLESMTPGRIAAQCAHAANQFVGQTKEMIECIDDPEDILVKGFNEWENQTDVFFGTTIVLNGVSEEIIRSTLDKIENNYFTSLVIDPEYHIWDGKKVWIIPDVLTCAYAFLYEEDDDILKDFKRL